MLRYFLLFSVTFGALLQSAPAESWPTLSKFVSDCILIVKAKQVGPLPEVQNGTLAFKVIETWKGSFDPHDFSRTSPDGYIYANQGEHGVNVGKDQEIIFFFTRHNQPTSKISRHSTAFPITAGRLTYASTGWDMKREYTVEEFRSAIDAIVKKNEF